MSDFTPLPREVFDALLVYNLTGRERQVVELIIRCTYGITNGYWASLHLADLQIVNIAPPHAAGIMKQLLEKGIVVQNGTTKEYRLHTEYLLQWAKKNAATQFERLVTVIGTQLKKKTSQISNQDVTQSVTENLPKEEDTHYQYGNNEPLPKEKVLGSEKDEFPVPIDKVYTNIINSDKQEIANNISSKKQDYINPKEYEPQSLVDYQAKATWERLEPKNPKAFISTYLRAAKLGLPAMKFYEFASEIEQDPAVQNRGAVFNKKVDEYMVDLEARKKARAYSLNQGI